LRTCFLTKNGPADGIASTGVAGVSGGTAQKYGSASRCRKSGARSFRWIVSSSPSARHDETSRRYGSPGDTRFGVRARSNARTNARGVTASPFENFQPSAIRKVYVRPSSETCGGAAAASGSRRVPSGRAFGG
jgi:hypothetical protein